MALVRFVNLGGSFSDEEPELARMIRFSAKIYKLGINPVVDPPDDVLRHVFEEAGRAKGPIPVHGRLNGVAFIQTLVKYRGAWRLYVNGKMLKDSALEVGDAAQIELKFDPRPRELAMPKAFVAALQKDKKARAEFEKLTPSRRKEILQYLGSLKKAEAVERNVERVIKHLLNAPTDR